MASVRSRWVWSVLWLGLATAVEAQPAHTTDACGLLTPAEVEAATGLKVEALSTPGAAPGGLFCMGQAPTATVTLRIGNKPAASKGGASKGGASASNADGTQALEVVRRMGAVVERKSFGRITCTTLMPPPNMAAQLSYSTTCGVTKGTLVAAIEVAAKAQKDMIPIEKLRPLAKKMGTRLK